MIELKWVGNGSEMGPGYQDPGMTHQWIRNWTRLPEMDQEYIRFGSRFLEMDWEWIRSGPDYQKRIKIFINGFSLAEMHDSQSSFRPGCSASSRLQTSLRTC